MTEAAPAQGQAAPSEATADIQPEQAQQADERSYTQADLNKIAANEKREGRSAERAAIFEELSDYGVEDLDGLKETLEAYRAVETELEGEEVQKMKSEHRKALKAVQQKSSATRRRLTKYLEAGREGVQEHIIPLLDKMDVADQLAYIAEHGDAIKGNLEPSVPPSIGAGSSPGAANNGTPKNPAYSLGRPAHLDHRTSVETP